MRSEIGSDYWLTNSDYELAINCKDVLDFPYDFPNVSLTNLCRTGIELLLYRLDIQNGIVIVPEFTCHSVIEPFLHHGFKVESYAINRDLSINEELFISQVQQVRPNIVIVHSYFGFNTIIKCLRAFLPPSTILIEDITQRFLSSFQLIDADYYVGSIRKWFPIPDGGFYSGKTEIQTLKYEDGFFIDLELKALLSKGQYMQGEIRDKSTFRKSFSLAREVLDKGERLFAMSKLSKQIYNSIDISNWKSKRQDNGRFLIDKLKAFDFFDLIFDQIDLESVPFLIPVLVRDKRKDFQTFLARNDIYATVIWTCPELIKDQLTPVGQYIYDHILCFHCDQRYDLDDMQRIIDVISNYQQSKL